jgi:stress-induced-phosphoprotein 1
MNTAEAAKSRGNELYKARKFSEAVAAYDEAISAFPYELTFFTNKAAALLEDGKFDEALKVLTEALSRKSEISAISKEGASFEKVAKVYLRIGNIHMRQNRFEDAISAYNKALTENNDRNTRNLLREAEAARDKSLKEAYLDPVKAEEAKDRGNTHFRNSKFAEAKTEYDEAIKRNPTDAKLYSNRAAALTKLAAYPDAVRDLDECLRLDPTFVKAYSRKGLALFFLKDYNKALAAYEAGLKLEPTNQELVAGRRQVLEKIQTSYTETEPDPEQVKRAMADPEIQQILKDPQMQIILQMLQENPKAAAEALRDPKVASALNKLVAAGIVRMH